MKESYHHPLLQCNVVSIRFQVDLLLGIVEVPFGNRTDLSGTVQLLELMSADTVQWIAVMEVEPRNVVYYYYKQDDGKWRHVSPGEKFEPTPPKLH